MSGATAQRVLQAGVTRHLRLGNFFHTFSVWASSARQIRRIKVGVAHARCVSPFAGWKPFNGLILKEQVDS
jgi:hypothetical protein